MDVQIRWMTRKDIPEVLEIEQSCFENPWSAEDFSGHLKLRNTIGMVSEDRQHQIIGFMVYALEKSVLEVRNFAVAAGYRMRGVGDAMAMKLIAKLSQQRRQKIIVAVRETNLDAQLFFHAIGFNADYVLRGWYEDTGEDAFRFSYELPVCERLERRR